MIEARDVVIALSNSGETPELSAIITYTKRFNIPLVAITQEPKSSLAKAATHSLILPKIPEACPLSLAPTTSTTMMLALGDAIAMSLLEAKGFSAKDFGTFHPGGKLGRQLMRVSDLMHQNDMVPLIDESEAMSNALITMTEKTFGCVGITNSTGTLLGVITDGDLRRHMGPELLNQSVKTIMSNSPLSTTPESLAVEALALMNEKSVTSLFVVKSDKPVGIIRLHDCLRVGLQ
jgi:arabinose-5-phosphate isomerase